MLILTDVFRSVLDIEFSCDCPWCTNKIQIKEWVGNQTTDSPEGIQFEWIHWKKAGEMFSLACKEFRCVSCEETFRIVNSLGFCRFCPSRLDCLIQPSIETRELYNIVKPKEFYQDVHQNGVKRPGSYQNPVPP